MCKSVDEGAGVEAEDQHRSVAEGTKDRQRERRVMRELKDKPGGRHRLHPRADHRHRLPDEIASELRERKTGNRHVAASARLDTESSVMKSRPVTTHSARLRH